MKKILSLILAVAMMLLLVACAGEVGEEGDISLVVENRDGSYDVYKVYLEDVTNKEEGVYGVVEFIMQRKENPITADIVDSSYGAYVNYIGSLTPDASKNEYVCLYTSLEKDFGTWDGVKSVVYEGVTLKEAGVGLTSMSIEKGTVVLFRIETYTI